MAFSCDGEDTEQTDGIGTTNAIEQLDQFAKIKRTSLQL